jgi:dienelactone hydrolase
MNKILYFLKNFPGRIRTMLTKCWNRVVQVCKLTPGHWRWATYGILFIVALVLLGLWIDFAGVLHIGIFGIALVFFLGIPLLIGLGIRLGLKILRVIPERFGWIYFGAVFFVFFIFRFPEKALIIIALIMILTGSFLGAGIYNVTGKRWTGLSRTRKILTILFLVLGAALFSSGWWYILFPGKAPEELKIWSMETEFLPPHANVSDPSVRGTYEVDSLTYGWGEDRRRSEFAEQATIITPVVDGSSFLDGWEKLSGKLRTIYWKMGPDSLALNGRVWYPLGEGPFPLVLMVHGNHLDRDFSDPGYAYLGRHFASHGIISVSVDENFLNGAWSDFSKGLETENDCRGWLLLKHLEQWRNWNECDTSLFSNRVDMDRIVLIGHSRGGEAVSIASCFNQLPFYPDNADETFDFGFSIKGIAAIAPVDGQYWPAGKATPLQDVNYFTIHGSMDGDMRSYDGLRQMRRAQFMDTTYHFASGLYLHGANHGQFNQSWGLFDNGYPNKLFMNRRAIIPADQQEKVALVYLTAFVKESVYPGSGYLPLFKDYRVGRNWLPDLVYLNQFHESSATIICEFEEDMDLTSGTVFIDSMKGVDLALWKEGRIPKKWGDFKNNGVFLGWNNEKDSIPGTYQIVLDSNIRDTIADAGFFTFLAADAQVDPGERKDTTEVKNEKGKNDPGSGNLDKGVGENNEEEGEKDDEDPVPVDFSICMTDAFGKEYRVKLGQYQKLQPPIKPEVFKSRLFWDDPESEVILQYVSIPLEAFKDEEHKSIVVTEIRSIRFEFDAEKKGAVILDQIGFTRE